MDPTIATIITAVLTAVITGGLSLVGVIITNNKSNAEIENKLTVSQAITTTKLEALADEVRKHTDFANRIPLIEGDITSIKYGIQKLESVCEDYKRKMPVLESKIASIEHDQKGEKP